MVNCIDNEKLLKNIITQFCDQNFKFTLNLKILGSIHVQVDNNEVLTCLLDEKFFKSTQNRSLITTNQNLFNPLSVVKPLSENNTALNLVTTLNQLQQQQQQLKLVNPSHLVPSVKTPSLSSSSSTSSKSSTSSASSFMSGDLKQHKRKRSNGQKSDDGSSASSMSCRSSRRENQNTDEEDEDEGNSSDHNDNNEHENDNENENLNNSSANQTPVKRNKRDDGVDTHDEAAAAAASALSLISAAAVASKLYSQQNLQNNQQAPQHNFHSITSHLNPYQSYQSNNNNENEQPCSSSLPSSSSNVPVQTQKPLKPKSKYLMNDYEQQLKQQIFQQSIENTAQNFNQSQQYTNNSYNQVENDKKLDTNEQEDHDSSLEESQLYMDEDNLNKNDKENEEQKPQISQIIQQENHSSINHLQQQQNLMMAAAAAALMNNNNVNQQVNGTDNSNLKLFMPHSLALNLAAVKQQQQQQQIQQIQNGEKAGKKKCKNGTGSNLMSPSSSNLVPANGPNSNKSTTSTTSCSSLSSNGSSTKQGKKSRQTIAALAAAAAAARTNTTTQSNPLTPANQNVKIATMVNQFGLKENNNIDQIINEVTEKSKISVITPKPNVSKHLKKQHLLSASIQNSPISPSSTNIKKEKVKKIKPNGHFTDSSNIMTQNIVTNNNIPQTNPVILPNSVQVPSQQTNPTQAAVAAAAVALQYHQFLNNNLNKNNSVNNATPQKPNPKFHLANGGYVEEAENQMRAPVKYEDADEEEPCEDDEKETGHLNGPLSIKSLTGPLTQSNTNSQGPNSGPGGNLEFECTACEKKFKYYCYYKRHMDACHSDMPKYVCEICHKSYKWEASFRQHLRTHHNIIQAENENDKNLDGKNEEDSEENNENRRINESSDEMKENGHHEDEDDEEEPDVESNERIHPSEHRNIYYERDHEQIGAAGTLASIAESLNGMHGRLMINNHNMS